MKKALKDRVVSTWVNLQGWRTRRRIVVFESDDWGAIRMPNSAAFDRLAKQGLDLTSCPYDRLDCLEKRCDLDALFNILDAHWDSQGKPPVFTFNTVMGNPDFEAIKASGFRSFVHEGLFQSYHRYHGEDLKPVWKRAMQASLMKPQFHGREHLNVGLWLNDLRSGNRDACRAFEHGYFGLTTKTSSSRQRNYLAAYWPESASHLAEIQTIMDDGLTMFEGVFGFPSQSFVACNYVLPRELEPALARRGVRLIQGQRGQLMPSADGKEIRIRRCFTGQRNDNGQVYSVRNVKFEPFEDPSRDWIDAAMGDISAAFFWRKPAIISTHRVNYVSGMAPANRDRSLRLLEQLLYRIMKKWPDVEFMSSDALPDMIDN